MSRLVSAQDVSKMLTDGEEIAFIDVREIMPFGTGHALLAANLPLSEIEITIGMLVPRRDTRMVLMDGGEGEATVAAARLEPLGYTDIAVMEGGAPAWREAGEALFPEIEVPAKGFGAFARINGKPNFISPHELNDALDSDEDWIVLDSRPNREFRWGNIPGSINVPSADLVRSFDDLVPDPNTKVVVNCMSGTRGILGGLSLVAAGVPNEVRVLFHGTRGWLLDGYELEKDSDRAAAPPSDASREGGIARAARIAEAAGIKKIDTETLGRWRSEPERTTYLLDVRTHPEFEAGHIPGSRCAPEGRLPMSPEQYFATLNARYVLIDDDTVRATVNALWLTKMGWGEIVILENGLEGEALATGPEPASDLDFSDLQAPCIDIETLSSLENVRLIDVGTSDAHEAGHIPGAIWCSRVALADLLQAEPHDGPTVLTSEDGLRAKLAARDLGDSLPDTLSVLEGGNAAWKRAGNAPATGILRLASTRVDHWLASSERPGDVRQNVVDYLDWEITLYDDIERGGPVPYRNLIWA
ncbi:MAG: rhodanese-like domain-containing protein [Rhodospirillaceae bacterium]|nr:rhodanese-like domain-containing protein [Rhodospirillaceae bacterium]MDD9913794.1 rhodanese-like domain-containing protein [Rhodospirillaceae bacterium]